MFNEAVRPNQVTWCHFVADPRAGTSWISGSCFTHQVESTCAGFTLNDYDRKISIGTCYETWEIFTITVQLFNDGVDMMLTETRFLFIYRGPIPVYIGPFRALTRLLSKPDSTSTVRPSALNPQRLPWSQLLSRVSVRKSLQGLKWHKQDPNSHQRHFMWPFCLMDSLPYLLMTREAQNLTDWIVLKVVDSQSAQEVKQQH